MFYKTDDSRYAPLNTFAQFELQLGEAPFQVFPIQRRHMGLHEANLYIVPDTEEARALITKFVTTDVGSERLYSGFFSIVNREVKAAGLNFCTEFVTQSFGPLQVIVLYANEPLWVYKAISILLGKPVSSVPWLQIAPSDFVMKTSAKDKPVTNPYSGVPMMAAMPQVDYSGFGLMNLQNLFSPAGLYSINAMYNFIRE